MGVCAACAMRAPARSMGQAYTATKSSATVMTSVTGLVILSVCLPVKSTNSFSPVGCLGDCDTGVLTDQAPSVTS